MPRVCRIRFVNVGHPDARLEDLILDLRAKDGSATDSTLWMRNGGGKSSILNLFFALVRPDLREFLGRQSETGKRRLDDYVTSRDHAVVACEWELDEQGALFDDGLARRYLTGFFAERQSGQDEQSSNLRRLFFAALVSADDPRLSIDGLPLLTGGERPARRTLASFRQEWLSLRDMYPHAEVMEADNQADWQKHLESRGIDSELFHYQIQMNEHEGGADKLFQFKEPEEFTDFLLELAMDRSHADDLRRNIATFREQLAKRKGQFLPEITLCDGLLERLGPMVKIAARRKASHEQACGAKVRLGVFDRYLSERITALQQDVAHLEEEQRQATVQMVQARQRAAISQRHAAALRKQAFRVLLDNAEAQLRESKKAYEQAERKREIWRAAIPLRKAQRCEAIAAGYREELSRKVQEHAPLLAELTDVASRLWAALSHQATDLRNFAADADDQKTMARDVANTCRQQSQQLTSTIAEALTTVRTAEAFLQSCESERARLVNRQILLPDETAADAKSRLAASANDLRGQMDKFVAQAAVLDQQLRELALRREDTVIARSKAVNDHHQCQKQVGEYSELRVTIEESPELRRLLELDRVDLEVSAERGMLLAQEDASKTLERLLLERMELAADQRAIAHLEKESLLPPSADAAAIRDQLRQKLRSVWTGWEYIAENCSDNEQRREAVRRAPHLAEGVVVRDSDFEKARELLRGSSVGNEMPVVVIPAGSFRQEDAVQGEVLLPPGDGLYDRSAGVQELSRRQQRTEQIEAELKSHESWRQALEQLIGQMREFRRRYPKGWLAVKQADLEAARLRMEDLASKVANLVEQAADHDQQKKQNEADQRTVSANIEQIREQRLHADNYLEQYESKQEVMKQKFEQGRQEVKSAQVQQDSLNRQAQEAEQQAEGLELQARRLGEEARTIEQRRDALEYVSQERPVASSAPIQELQDRYNRLRSQYLHKVGSHELQKMAEVEDRHVAEERTEFEQCVRSSRLTPQLKGEEVAIALAELGEGEMADEMFRQCEEAFNLARSRTGTDTQRKDRCQGDFEGAAMVCADLGDLFMIPEAEATLTPERARDEADRLGQEAEGLETAATEGESRAQKLADRCVLGRRQVEGMQKDRVRLQTINDSYGDLLNLLEDVNTDMATVPVSSDADLEPLLKEVEGSLRQFREISTELDRARDQVGQAVRGWLQNSQFDGLKTSIKAKFAELDTPSLETRVEIHVDDLTLRRSVIQDQLAELDKHRTLLVDNALYAADEGLALLRKASSQSNLPEELPGLGGTRFLDIHTRQLPDPAQRKACIAEMIDELVDAGEVPGGLQLLQRAVRRLARPIRVRVVHPDPDHNREMVDIADLGRLSGGEQLTCSVLLYCTLAQLRARSRGISRRPSSVLLLDNPIGRASRPRFLEMQREVARTMGVQLIYTTAVNDHEALRTLPNIIRLKNERQDRNTGRRVVEMDGPQVAAGLIEATRIVRDEPTALSESTRGDEHGDQTDV